MDVGGIYVRGEKRRVIESYASQRDVDIFELNGICEAMDIIDDIFKGDHRLFDKEERCRLSRGYLDAIGSLLRAARYLDTMGASLFNHGPGRLCNDWMLSVRIGYACVFWNREKLGRG